MPRRPRRARTEPTAPRRRLDAELVRRRLAVDLDHARRLVYDGLVVVGGAPADNPSRGVTPAESLAVSAPPPRFVSRGGEKLAAALTRFQVDLTDRRVLDAGASTGGFTDCALQAGASSVIAVDVGRAQIHQRIAADPRVDVHERTNVRSVEPGTFGAAPEIIVADLSFISLTTVLDALLGLAAPDADFVLLVKPQFEATREEVDAGRGVIADPAIWARTLSSVASALSDRGAAIMGAMTSPLRGAEGNVEFLLHARRTATAPTDRQHAAIDEIVQAAVLEADGPR